jgi:hypothetical protein
MLIRAFTAKRIHSTGFIRNAAPSQTPRVGRSRLLRRLFLQHSGSSRPGKPETRGMRKEDQETR